MGLKSSMTGILVRRGKDAKTYGEKQPCEDGGKDWS